MPTVLRVGGFKFSFYSDEHDPVHVHVKYSGASVIVDLVTGETRQNRGMKPPDLMRAVRLVEAHREQLLAAWTAFDQKRKGTNGLASN